VVDIYDANNVLRRAVEKIGMPTVVPMGFRQRYHFTCAKPHGSQIWVWDGPGHNDMRRALFPDYKMQREKPAMDIFAQINLWKDVLKLSPAVSVTCNGWEADDVIATLVHKFHARGIIANVHSNDIDYGQLEGKCNLVGVNLKDTPGRWLPLRKAMVGKPSDNMPGIPNMGAKRFQCLKPYWPQIETAILAGQADDLVDVGIPFTPSVRAWLAVRENAELLRAYLKVAQFFTVPDDELDGGMYQGQLDMSEAEALMSKFFL